jgi:hypothetical protein
MRLKDQRLAVLFCLSMPVALLVLAVIPVFSWAQERQRATRTANAQVITKSMHPDARLKCVISLEKVKLKPAAVVKKLGLPGMVAFVVVKTERTPRSKRETVSTLGLFRKGQGGAVGPEAVWCGAIAWAEDGKTAYVVLAESRNRDVVLDVYAFDLKKPGSKYPLVFNQKDGASLPKDCSPISRTRLELSRYGRFGKKGPAYQTGVGRLQATALSDHLLVCLERGDHLLRGKLLPVYLRLDLKTKKLREVTLQEKAKIRKRP